MNTPQRDFFYGGGEQQKKFGGGGGELSISAIQPISFFELLRREDFIRSFAPFLRHFAAAE
jgi:hypothetical protein